MSPVLFLTRKQYVVLHLWTQWSNDDYLCGTRWIMEVGAQTVKPPVAGTQFVLLALHVSLQIETLFGKCCTLIRCDRVI
jgi:hypothetical protein